MPTMVVKVYVDMGDFGERRCAVTVDYEPGQTAITQGDPESWREGYDSRMLSICSVELLDFPQKGKTLEMHDWLLAHMTPEEYRHFFSWVEDKALDQLEDDDLPYDYDEQC